MSTEQGVRARETMTPDAAVAFLVTSGKTQNQRMVTPGVPSEIIFLLPSLRGEEAPRRQANGLRLQWHQIQK